MSKLTSHVYSLGMGGTDSKMQCIDSKKHGSCFRLALFSTNQNSKLCLDYDDRACLCKSRWSRETLQVRQSGSPDLTCLTRLCRDSSTLAEQKALPWAISTRKIPNVSYTHLRSFVELSFCVGKVCLHVVCAK